MMGLQRQAGAGSWGGGAERNKKGHLEGGENKGAMVDWLEWEVGGLQDTFLYGEVGTTVNSEIVLGG